MWVFVGDLRSCMCVYPLLSFFCSQLLSFPRTNTSKSSWVDGFVFLRLYFTVESEVLVCQGVCVWGQTISTVRHLLTTHPSHTDLINGVPGDVNCLPRLHSDYSNVCLCLRMVPIVFYLGFVTFLIVCVYCVHARQKDLLRQNDM